MTSFDFEGRRVSALDGDTVASALFRAGVRTFSRSFKNHRRRGLYCLSGDCPNCLVTIDGEPGIPACTTPVGEVRRVERSFGWPSTEHDVLAVVDQLHWLFPVGFYYKTLVRPRGAWSRVEPLVRRMTGLGRVDGGRVSHRREARYLYPDVLVIGAGVAGLSAALAAADRGERVVLCDEGVPGERVAPGPTSDRIGELLEEVSGRGNIELLEVAAAIGIYEGPLVPVNSPGILHLVRPKRIVVATGAVERHAVFPGNDLPGVWLGRGVARLAGRHGVSPGQRAVIVTDRAEGLEHAETLRTCGAELIAVALRPGMVEGVGDQVLAGAEPVSARGRRGVREVVLSTASRQRAFPCDTLVLSLAPVPRDGLLRQAAGLPVVGAGEVVMPGCTLGEAEEFARHAALDGAKTQARVSVTPGPKAGCVCLCEDVGVRDLERAWAEGFRSTELLKRYTTATMGPCRGTLCQDPLSAFVRERIGTVQSSEMPTARAPSRPITLEEAASGHRDHLELRTTLHNRHLELGASMEWVGSWKRPHSYGDVDEEYWAVRQGVSIMDVGTLGKFQVAGPDAGAFLERLYPCRVMDIQSGRIRYALMLNEAGYVIDDGLICSLGDRGYYLTFTSGGAEQAEAWLRDWAETWNMVVHIVNRTAAVGAINVAGPRARDLLLGLGADVQDSRLPYLRHSTVRLGGIDCRVIRLGFVGELSFELHHASSESTDLWDMLLEVGTDLGIRPHGLEALRLLRLEKGHIIVGQDTDFDTTPSKLGLDWAIHPGKEYFLGQTALRRLASVPLERRLFGVVFDGGAPPEGAPLREGSLHVGYLTSSGFSPVLGHGIGLAWLRARDGVFPSTATAEGLPGRIVEPPFYDPRGERLRA